MKTLEQPKGIVLPDCGPEDFVLPREEPEVYWVCMGWRDLTKRKPKRCRAMGEPEGECRYLYLTPEDAERGAVEMSCPRWTWDGKPAQPRTIAQTIARYPHADYIGLVIPEPGGGWRWSKTLWRKA